MPGVPSGRGCDGCRKQKKKCDQRKPSCSRCLRLKLECHGAGERRYKFITNHDQTIVPTSDDRLKPARIVVLPHNATDLLVASMIETMKPSVDLKFNLAWSFGPFLEYVPQRLGRNAALDAAAKVVIAAHSNHCALIGCENRWTGHGEGAARLLKARGDRAADVQSAFTASMLASLSASVLFEGIFNPNIVFSPREWIELIGRWFDQDNDGCTMMRCLSHVPDHLFRGRRTIHEEPELVPEARSNHQKLQTLTFVSRQGLEQIRALVKTKEPGSKSHAHAFYLRVHALNIAVLIILSRVLFALDITAHWNLHQEAKELSNEVLFLAQEAKRYAPLGSSYVAICLCAAWIGCSDCDQKMLVEGLLLDFYNQNQTATLVDVLSVKLQELKDLRAARASSLNGER